MRTLPATLVTVLILSVSPTAFGFGQQTEPFAPQQRRDGNGCARYLGIHGWRIDSDDVRSRPGSLDHERCSCSGENVSREADREIRQVDIQTCRGHAEYRDVMSA